MEQHNVNAYLVNTGWSAGPYGIGARMSLATTRAIITAILQGSINNSEFEKDPVFGFEFPRQLDNVNSSVLNPKNTWQNPDEYDQARIKLAQMFIENFGQYESNAPHLKQAGPNV